MQNLARGIQMIPVDIRVSTSVFAWHEPQTVLDGAMHCLEPIVRFVCALIFIIMP
jgi:hypothetical protein